MIVWWLEALLWLRESSIRSKHSKRWQLHLSTLFFICLWSVSLTKRLYVVHFCLTTYTYHNKFAVIHENLSFFIIICAPNLFHNPIIYVASCTERVVFVTIFLEYARICNTLIFIKKRLNRQLLFFIFCNITSYYMIFYI